MSVTEPSTTDTRQHLLPCPSWCEGHPVNEVFYSDLGARQVTVEHVNRLGHPARPGQYAWMDDDLPVFLRQYASLVDGVSRPGSPQVEVKEWMCDSPEEAEQLAADLLAAAAIMRQAASC